METTGSQVIICPSCGQKNRVPNRARVARCGKCKAPLWQSSLAVKLLCVIGYTWLSILGFSVVIGGIGIIVFDGMWEFWAIFSPFNIWNWGLIFLLALPAIGSMKLAERLDRRILPPPQEESLQNSELTGHEELAKKSMLERARESLNNLKPEEWQEPCRNADAEEDAAIGHSAPEQPQVKAKPVILFPPNAHIRKGNLPKSEENARVEILEELLELEKGG